MLVRTGRDAAARVHRPRLPVRARRGRSTRRPGPCTARRCRPGCGRPSGSPSRSSPLDQGRARATTRTSPSTRPSTWSVPRRRATARDLSPGRSTERGAARAPRARHRHRRHQVRARLHRRRAGHLRRDPDARTRRGSGRPTSGSPGRRRRRSTSSRCATGRRRPAGTRPAAAGAARRVVAATTRPLRRRLRADHRAVASPTGTGGEAGA